jgi:hypothetical protein
VSRKTEHNPRIHWTPAETRERNYERLRQEGVPEGPARQIADEAARRSHDNLNRNG